MMTPKIELVEELKSLVQQLIENDPPGRRLYKTTEPLNKKPIIDNSSMENHPYTGKYIIVRSYGSGVHAGYLKSYDSQTQEAYLKKGRRLWHFTGFTLSQCANEGMIENKEDSAILSQVVDEIMITNVLELIPCTEKAQINIESFKTHDPFKE